MTNERAREPGVEGTGHEIRPLRTHEELLACVAFQHEIWGPGFSETVPISLLKVTQRLGGTLIGAWDEHGRLDGFVFGLSGLVDGRPVHWSDMLGVRKDRRDRGLGLALKRRQREELLRTGIRVCHWTFDPLEARNAHLNLGRLGALVREYVPDMYGASESPLHRGIGTDRLVALWRMDSARVEARLEGRQPPPRFSELGDLPRAFAVGRLGGLPSPGNAQDLAGSDRYLVPIPRSIQEVKAADPGLAAAWRRATRDVLQGPLGAGFQVSELVSTTELGYYLVERIPPEDDTW